jgi:hypothetical protein
MVFQCDWCGLVGQNIIKLPTSALSFNPKSVESSNTYINMCEKCLYKEMERMTK